MKGGFRRFSKKFWSPSRGKKDSNAPVEMEYMCGSGVDDSYRSITSSGREEQFQKMEDDVGPGIAAGGDVPRVGTATSAGKAEAGGMTVVVRDFDGDDVDAVDDRNKIRPMMARLDALQIQQQLQGMNHPDVLFALKHLGRAHRRRGEMEQAQLVDAMLEESYRSSDGNAVPF